jgi:uncharacterized membrane protein YjjB (DUF3815 family)
MELWTSLLQSLWAGLFATGLGILLTTPSRYFVPTFLCGFVGRFMRDLCMGMSLNQNWAKLIAATAVAVVAVATIRRHSVSPVVLICGVLPLGAAVAMFNLILALMRVSSLQGEALGGASVALSANLGKVFVTSLAIALGVAAGMAIAQLSDGTRP